MGPAADRAAEEVGQQRDRATVGYAGRRARHEALSAECADRARVGDGRRAVDRAAGVVGQLRDRAVVHDGGSTTRDDIAVGDRIGRCSGIDHQTRAADYPRATGDGACIDDGHAGTADDYAGAAITARAPVRAGAAITARAALDGAIVAQARGSAVEDDAGAGATTATTAVSTGAGTRPAVAAADRKGVAQLRSRVADDRAGTATATTAAGIVAAEGPKATVTPVASGDVACCAGAGCHGLTDSTAAAAGARAEAAASRPGRAATICVRAAVAAIAAGIPAAHADHAAAAARRRSPAGGRHYRSDAERDHCCDGGHPDGPGRRASRAALRCGVRAVRPCEFRYGLEHAETRIPDDAIDQIHLYPFSFF